MQIRTNHPTNPSAGPGAVAALWLMAGVHHVVDRFERARSDEHGAIDLVTLVILVVAVAALALVVWGIIEAAVTDKVNDLNLDAT